MKLGSLCSGIGGFELAASWLGWETIFNCEIDSFCQAVLKKNFPNTFQYADIHSSDFTHFRDKINILCGGIPCQPFSVAGRNTGTTDERWLWKEMFRVVQETQPEWVIIENVRGILINQSGMAAQSIQSDLESIGFTVQIFCLSANACGAPHERERVWFIANTNRQRLQPNEHPPKHKTDQDNELCLPSCKRDEPSIRMQYSNRNAWQEDWTTIAPQPEFCGVDDGLSNRMDRRSRNQNKRFKAIGNAIVPQVAFQIFKAIQYAEASN